MSITREAVRVVTGNNGNKVEETFLQRRRERRPSEGDGVQPWGEKYKQGYSIEDGVEGNDGGDGGDGGWATGGTGSTTARG